MRFFDHFGHFAHGHGALGLVIVVVLIAVGVSVGLVLRGRKGTDA